MKRRWVMTALLTVFSGATLLAVSTVEPDGLDASGVPRTTLTEQDLAAIQLVVEPDDAGNGHHFSLVNNSWKTIWYTGYSPNLPAQLLREVVGEQETALQVSFCGTGLGLHALAPKASRRLDVGVGGEAGTFRVGVSLTDAGGAARAIWSDPVVVNAEASQ